MSESGVPAEGPPEGPLEFDQLPEKILLHVFSMLEVPDLVQVGMTNKRLMDAANHESLWEAIYESTNWQFFVSFTGEVLTEDWKTVYVNRLQRERLMQKEDQFDGPLSEDGEGSALFIAFDSMGASPLDTLLSKQDATVAEFLDLEEFITALNARNEKLVEHFKTSNAASELIDFVVNPPSAGSGDEPEEDGSPNSMATGPGEVDMSIEAQDARRHAYVAYQALITDFMTELLIADYSLLDQLFSFLDHPARNDALRNGYFSKIVLTIYENFPAELFLYFSIKSFMVTKFVRNIKNLFVMELLFKFIDSLSSHQWLADEKLIQQLVDLLDEEKSDVETQESAVRTLEIICNICSYCPYSVLVSQILEMQEVTEKLLAYTLAESPTREFRMKQGLGIVIQVLNLLHKDADSLEFDDFSPSDEEVERSKEAPLFVREFTAALPEFVQVLEAPSSTRPLINSAGTVNSPFGFTRLRVLEFVVGLMGTGFPAVIAKLVDLGVFSTCLNIFFAYPWNNFIHHQVYLMMSRILASGEAQVIQGILERSKLIDTILDVFEHQDSNTVGYFGHLVELCNEILGAAGAHQEVATYLDSFPSWPDFVSLKLEAINEICNPSQGPYDLDGLDDEEEEDDLPYDAEPYYYGLGQFGPDADEEEEGEYDSSSREGMMPPREHDDDDDDEDSSGSSDDDQLAKLGKMLDQDLLLTDDILDHEIEAELRGLDPGTLIDGDFEDD